MNDKNLAYCSECEDLVEFTEKEEVIEETYKGESVKFIFKVGRCKECGHEVATDLDYNTRRSLEKIEAYKKLKGIILEQEIAEILEKYDVGKEALADIAGFGKARLRKCRNCKTACCRSCNYFFCFDSCSCHRFKHISSFIL